MRKPKTAASVTPNSDPILPSETEDRAIPPVMEPTEDHPICSTMLSAAIALDGHQPRE
jgi:hypothetical protein